MVTLIGSLAGVLTTGCWLPQLVKSARLGDADEFAWPYLAMLFIGVTAWTVYGALRGDTPIWLCNGITSVFVVMVVCIKVRGERSRPRQSGVGAP